MEKIYKLAFRVWFDKEYPRDSDGKHGFDSDYEYHHLKESLFEAYLAGAEFERVATDAGM
jgi:hypothetical protein